jgi:hypothetical protein
MNFRSLFAVAAIAAAAVPAHADTIVGWTFEGASAPTSSTTSWTGIASSIGTGSASGVHATASAFSTPVGNGSAASVSATNWAVGDYWQFSFSTVGYTGLSITFDQAGSNTGPRDFAFAYSVNGGAYTTFSTYSVAAGSFSNTGNAAGVQNPTFAVTMDLSSIAALNNVSNVSVRLIDNGTASINGGTVGSGGTGRVDNFLVSGTVAAVPEPETYALMMAGLGIVGFIAKRRKV